MKKNLLLLALITLFSSITFSNIQAKNKNDILYLASQNNNIKEFKNTIEEMSLEQLQNLMNTLEQIDNKSYKYKPRSSSIYFPPVGPVIPPKDIPQKAWLTAAAIARKAGYDLSATIVEHSVLHKDYTETNGKFARAIKGTSTYGKLPFIGFGSNKFSVTVNKDLFYAINLFNYDARIINKKRIVTITDTFDFELDLEGRYGTLFRQLINNWGWLNQHANILYPSKITIRIQH